MIGGGIFRNGFAFEKEGKEDRRKELVDVLRLDVDVDDEY